MPQDAYIQGSHKSESARRPPEPSKGSAASSRTNRRPPSSLRSTTRILHMLLQPHGCLLRGEPFRTVNFEAADGVLLMRTFIAAATLPRIVEDPVY
jgi:hypothetical protein